MHWLTRWCTRCFILLCTLLIEPKCNLSCTAISKHAWSHVYYIGWCACPCTQLSFKQTVSSPETEASGGDLEHKGDPSVALPVDKTDVSISLFCSKTL